MLEPNPINAEIIKGIGIIEFEQDYFLILTPLTPWQVVDDLDSLVLYENGTLSAFVVNQPSQYTKEEDKGFWSAGKINQQTFYKFWDNAINYLDKSKREDQDSIYRTLLCYGINTRNFLKTNQFREYTKEIPFLDKLPDEFKQLSKQ
ncbi:MAG: hypothetical protein ACP5N2_04315 [Candidatus Nanoarchaeia archaeon]